MAKQDSPSLIRHPISLVAYALSLVFSVLAAYNPSDLPWWPYVAAFTAMTSVIGGLWLAHHKMKPTGKSEQQRSSTATSIRQETHGSQSPLINDTKNVTISYGTPSKGKK